MLVFTTAPVTKVSVTGAGQLSVAVAVPKAALIAAAVGLQPRAVVPPDAPAVSVITGAVTSTTLLVMLHVTGTVQLLQVKLDVNVKEPQLEPGFTQTVVPVFGPLNEAPEVLLLKDQVMVDWLLQIPLTVTV